MAVRKISHRKNASTFLGRPNAGNARKAPERRCKEPVVVACTLGLGTDLALLDEPTEGVQPENIDRRAKLVKQRCAMGASFIVVEQNLAFAEAVADDLLVLDHSEVVAQGGFAAMGREAIESDLMV